MTPEEAKARELVEKFHRCMYAPIGGGAYTYTNRAKACAISCVDEIIAALQQLNTDKVSEYDYWLDVKQHLIDL